MKDEGGRRKEEGGRRKEEGGRPGSPRVHAAGGSPSTYGRTMPAQKPPRSRGGRVTFNLRANHARPEAPAFTRREGHLQPTGEPCPPRSPRVHAAGECSPSTYGRTMPAQKPPRSRGESLTFNLRANHARPEAPAFTRREPHHRPTNRAATSMNSQMLSG